LNHLTVDIYSGLCINNESNELNEKISSVRQIIEVIFSYRRYLI